MIIGAHSIVQSTQPDADRAFLRDILKLNHVDVGEGWLIFGLPPAEVAIHPSESDGVHELYLMVDNVEAFVDEMKSHEIASSEIKDEGWGLLTSLTLPGGGKLGVYEPRHARPEPSSNGHNGHAKAGRPNAAAKKRAGKKKAAKKAGPAKKAAPAKKKKKAAKKRR